MTSKMERFGRMVLERRIALGISQRRAWKAGGPSMPTWTAIESGEATDLQPRTLAKLDRVLAWQPGSAAAALAGGEPTALDQTGMAPWVFSDEVERTQRSFAVSEIARVLGQQEWLDRIQAGEPMDRVMDDASVATLHWRIDALGRIDQLVVSQLVDELTEAGQNGGEDDGASVARLSDRRATVTPIEDDESVAAYTAEEYEGDPSVDTIRDP